MMKYIKLLMVSVTSLACFTATNVCAMRQAASRITEFSGETGRAAPKVQISAKKACKQQETGGSQQQISKLGRGAGFAAQKVQEVDFEWSLDKGEQQKTGGCKQGRATCLVGQEEREVRLIENCGVSFEQELSADARLRQWVEIIEKGNKAQELEERIGHSMLTNCFFSMVARQVEAHCREHKHFLYEEIKDKKKIMREIFDKGNSIVTGFMCSNLYEVLNRIDLTKAHVLDIAYDRKVQSGQIVISVPILFKNAFQRYRITTEKGGKMEKLLTTRIKMVLFLEKGIISGGTVYPDPDYATLS